MATTPRRTPARQMFVNLLFSFYNHCGAFHEKEIATLGSQVPELYPDYRGGVATGLSAINIYKILRGYHKQLVGTRQLSVLVLALQHLAYRSHIRDHDPGCASLAAWQALLSQARALNRVQRSQGTFVRGAAHDVDLPLYLTAPPPAASAGLTPATLIRVTPIQITQVEMHELVALGQCARMLALRAAAADHRAFYELAVILGTASASHNQRAATFAIAAAAAAPGSSPASDLLNADTTLNPDRAASHARVLAHAAADRGDHETARMFDYCADRVGNPSLQSQAPLLRD